MGLIIVFVRYVDNKEYSSELERWIKYVVHEDSVWIFYADQPQLIFMWSTHFHVRAGVTSLNWLMSSKYKFMRLQNALWKYYLKSIRIFCNQKQF